MTGAFIATVVVVTALVLDRWRKRRRLADDSIDEGTPLSWRDPMDVILVVVTVVAMIFGGLWILAS